MSLYEFEANDAYRFAEFVNAKTKSQHGNLQFLECPQCRGGKKRDKYTFGINLKTGQCQCMRSSCSYKGNMVTLARDFGFYLNDDVAGQFNIDDCNDKFKSFKNAHKTFESKDVAIEYMASRGISAEVVKKYEITSGVDYKTGIENIIVFPFKDDKGTLTYVKYRNKDFIKGVSEGGKEWSIPNCMPILFGMFQCDLSNKTLIITEGQMDSLSVAVAGFENALSVPNGCNGFTWIPHCWDWLHENFTELIVFGDREVDEEGNVSMTLLDTLSKRLKLKIKHVQFEDYRGCKDANEILQKYGPEQIKICIDNAIQIPVKRVVALNSVKSNNADDMEKLKTGIKDLDRALKGGLPFGGVTLLTGKAGEGKSTFGSQLILQAVEQRYKCFAYSGELPNALFKEWLDRQAVGVGGIEEEYNKEYDYTKYWVAEDYQRCAEKWYKAWCYLYDNDYLPEEDEELVSLSKLIEDTVMQYDVRVLLLDNLMTAMDLERIEGDDKYDLQSKFCKRLARLAQRFNLCIILVAHKRKNAAGLNTNDEIAGSSDIANTAMVTLSYEKTPNDKEPEIRLLKLCKNRLFGTTNNEGWRTKYNEKCKRIYQEGFDCNWHYSLEFPKDKPEEKEMDISQMTWRDLKPADEGQKYLLIN